MIQDFIKDIVFLYRTRYQCCSLDFVDAIEGIDNELNAQIYKMFKYYYVNEDSLGTFYRVFKELLEENMEWKQCYQEFGKDFDFTAELLKEKMDNFYFCQG